MPSYDPDAEIQGLTFTIPSWISSMERACRNTDFRKISGKAADDLGSALVSLHKTIAAVAKMIKETR